MQIDIVISSNRQKADEVIGKTKGKLRELGAVEGKMAAGRPYWIRGETNMTPEELVAVAHSSKTGLSVSINHCKGISVTEETLNTIVQKHLLAA